MAPPPFLQAFGRTIHHPISPRPFPPSNALSVAPTMLPALSMHASHWTRQILALQPEHALRMSECFGWVKRKRRKEKKERQISGHRFGFKGHFFSLLLSPRVLYPSVSQSVCLLETTSLLPKDSTISTRSSKDSSPSPYTFFIPQTPCPE